MSKRTIRIPTTMTLLALASVAVIALLTACADQSSQFEAQCSDSRAIHDPENKPGLVSDCVTLLIIKDALDESGNLNWSPDIRISDWDSVIIENNRVFELILSDNQLSGDIPPELGNLANLHVLYLGDNQLTGEIPSWLGNLANLEFLSLGDNQLMGEIPPELGNLANLWGLRLSGNQLTGEIPPELGNLANLHVLYLGDNQLTGEIPSWLGNLADLEKLQLDTNYLTGEIPSELSNLANLEALSLHENRLTGCIPASLRAPLDYPGVYFVGDIEQVGLPMC